MHMQSCSKLFASTHFQYNMVKQKLIINAFLKELVDGLKIYKINIQQNCSSSMSVLHVTDKNFRNSPYTGKNVNRMYSWLQSANYINKCM